MVARIRKFGGFRRDVEYRMTSLASRSKETARNKPLPGGISESYDDLDFRLMATFPASDAIAQY